MPEGSRIKLLDRDAPASVEVERKVWYALWGGVDLSDTHTASMIAEQHLTEVRLHAKYTAWDLILNTVTSLLGFSRKTVLVEGNAK